MRGSRPIRAAFAQLPQELVRGNKASVLLEDAADDDHRMGPHHLNDGTPAKLGEIVCSYDRALVRLIASPIPIPRDLVV